MPDELTTAMHEELIGGEIPHLDFMCMAVYGAMVRGATKEQACEKYQITVAEYDANIERVLNSEDY